MPEMLRLIGIRRRVFNQNPFPLFHIQLCFTQQAGNVSQSITEQRRRIKSDIYKRFYTADLLNIRMPGQKLFRQLSQFIRSRFE